METNIAIILGVVVMLALAAAAILFLRKRSADRLRSSFGPEYERAVEAAGGRHKAQIELHQRQKRVRSLDIKPLTPEQRDHYMPLWEALQTQFVEDPKAAAVGADQLLVEVMTDRGYPAGDFERRSADLSVDHPVAVQNYRAAHDIAVRNEQGEANTEDLRQAILGYRVLFRDLVGEPVDEAIAAEDRADDRVADDRVADDRVQEPAEERADDRIADDRIADARIEERAQNSVEERAEDAVQPVEDVVEDPVEDGLAPVDASGGDEEEAPAEVTVDEETVPESRPVLSQKPAHAPQPVNQ